jgi:type VI secretion system secreted protein VgrG
MSSSATQASRLATLNTPLGADTLLLCGLKYKDGLGQPFELTLDVQSQSASINLNQILGQSVTVTINLPNGSQRYLNGVVKKFTQTVFSNIEGIYAYQMLVVPAFSMLSLVSDCRTFQNMTIPNIIKQEFSNVSFSAYSLSLTADYVAREYCIMYNESVFDFVSRLMEFAGISYYFQHVNGKHTMVLCDSPSAYSTYPGYSSVTYSEDQGGVVEMIAGWTLEGEVSSGAYVLNDYDYASPKTSMLGTSTNNQSNPLGTYQRYEYPGYYQTQDTANNYAQIRLQEVQCRQTLHQGWGAILGIASGYEFTLSGHPLSSQNSTYLTISSSLEIQMSTWLAASKKAPDKYRCDFTCIPNSVTFRPARTTRKPTIGGVHTAIVVGPSGQTATTPYVSSYGSVVVQFWWDRYGQNNQTSSIYIRVAQPSAGNNWGSMFIPRIGNEVVVAFEEGDPDRPIIIGSVYNATNMPMLPLPTNNLVTYISDDGGNIITWNPTSNQQSVIIYSPYKTTSKVIGYTYGNITYS